MPPVGLSSMRTAANQPSTGDRLPPPVENATGVWHALGAYGGAATLSVLILILVMRLWRADLTVPFDNKADALWMLASIKSLVDGPWILHNDRLGMPFGMETYDFPGADSLNFAALKVLVWIFHDPALVMNVYFLLGFPLATLTSLFVLRRFHISYAVAISVSLLYTFLPYHFLRGEKHLLLAAYYVVPLMVMVVLQVYLDHDLFFRRDRQRKRLVGTWRSSRSLVALALCVIFASTGVYYAFFTCFLLAVAGAAACFHNKRLDSAYRATIAIAVVSVAVTVNVLPTLVYQARHGGNPAAAPRTHADAEAFGLKVAHLLLPLRDHRWPILARITAKYLSIPWITNNNENMMAALGSIGSTGFLFLLARLLQRKRGRSDLQLLDALSVLNVFAVLFGTIGGFSVLVAVMGFAWIRGYNRISIFIAFFAFFAVAILLDRMRGRFAMLRAARTVFAVALGLTVTVGILDQTTRQFVPRYSELKECYRTDAKFVGQVEASLPQEAMIFQLPYLAWPHYDAPCAMQSFDHLHVYLHSKTLRWSYGAMVGREGDLWQKTTAEMPIQKMIAALSVAGFRGIYLDRNGYADWGADMVAKLLRLLEVTPLDSADQRLVFFDMARYQQATSNRAEIQPASVGDPGHDDTGVLVLPKQVRQPVVVEVSHANQCPARAQRDSSEILPASASEPGDDDTRGCILP